MAFTSRSNNMRTTSRPTPRSTMPANNNPVSKDQAILIGNLLSSIPVTDGGPTARRGFALQSAKQADVAEFVTGWAVDHATVTLGSDIISSLMDEKKGNGPKPVAVAVAGWLDGLAIRGVGAEAFTAWQAGRVGVVGTNAVKAAASSALDRLRNVQPAAPAAAPAAPAAPAVDINAIVAQAVAAAMSQVAEANAKVIADLMAQNAALMNAATEAKVEAATAQAETVTVVPTASKAGKGNQATK